MRGSIKQRSRGSWTFTVDVTTVSGKRRQKTRTVGKKQGVTSRKEAEREFNIWLGRLESGAEGVSSKMSFSALCDRVHDHRRGDPDLRASTHRGYADQMRLYVRPLIGKVALRDLKPAHVELVMDAMRDQGLAPATRRRCLVVLKHILGQAVEWQLLAANPAASVKPPKAQRPKLDVPTAEQLAALIEAAKGTSWEIPLLISCVTGARRSEVLGLKWQDVDLTSGTVHVERSLQRIPQADGSKRLVFTPVKTARARRSVMLPAVALVRLRQHASDQKQKRLKLGPAWQPLDLVCARGDGGALDPDGMTKAFKAVAAAAGLSPQTRLHDVRHGVATALAQGRMPLVLVSAILGHSSPAFTATVYQHAWPEGAAEVATALGEALGL